jgi:hypothetical protein
MHFFSSRGLYYKILQIHNLQKNGQILPQASAFLLSVTNTLVLTNTLTYYGIHRLRIRNVFIVQAPGCMGQSFAPSGTLFLYISLSVSLCVNTSLCLSNYLYLSLSLSLPLSGFNSLYLCLLCLFNLSLLVYLCLFLNVVLTVCISIFMCLCVSLSLHLCLLVSQSLCLSVSLSPRVRERQVDKK